MSTDAQNVKHCQGALFARNASLPLYRLVHQPHAMSAYVGKAAALVVKDFGTNAHGRVTMDCLCQEKKGDPLGKLSFKKEDDNECSRNRKTVGL